jgi:hypothetical protein
MHAVLLLLLNKTWQRFGLVKIIISQAKLLALAVLTKKHRLFAPVRDLQIGLLEKH